MSNATGDLAILGGEPHFKQECTRTIFKDDIMDDISVLLKNRPLSSLFGDYDVKEFERVFAEFTETRHAIAVNAGTSALHASLIALGISRGDEIAVTCLSFIATASVIMQAGAIPVFVDIDPGTFAIDLEDLKQKASSRTKAVIAVHLFGIPADVDELQKYCSEQGLFFIEDSCQALGATVGGVHVGNFGDLGCFSFNVNKIVQTGEGGMVICKEESLAEIVRELRVNGLSPFGCQRLGFNYTMTNLQAFLGLYQMKFIDDIIHRRRKNVEILTSYFANLNVVRGAGADSVCANYAIPILLDPALCKYRDGIAYALSQEGVPVAGSYSIMYEHDFVKQYCKSEPEKCRVAEEIAPRLITINPSHLYTERESHLIGEAVAKVFKSIDAIVGYVDD